MPDREVRLYSRAVSPCSAGMLQEKKLAGERIMSGRSLLTSVNVPFPLDGGKKEWG